MKIEIVLEFDFTDKELEILKHFKEKPKRQIEFRDYEYSNEKDFLESDEFKNGLRNLEWFKRRNPFDSELFDILYDKGVVEDVSDCWHTTFKLSDLGQKIIQKV